jgi:hypothetical protein
MSFDLIMVLFLIVISITIIFFVWRKALSIFSKATCPSCEFNLPIDAKFCPKCGRPRLPRWVELSTALLRQEQISEKKASPDNSILSPEPGTQPIFLDDVEGTDTTAINREKISKPGKQNLPLARLQFDNDHVIELPVNRKFFIGNTLECDWHLDGVQPPIVFAAIFPARTTYYLENLRGGQEIFLNGNIVSSSARLENGATITVAGVSCKFILDI